MRTFTFSSTYAVVGAFALSAAVAAAPSGCSSKANGNGGGSTGGSGSGASHYCYLYQSAANGSKCNCFNTDHSASYSGSGYTKVDDCDVPTVGAGGACCANTDSNGLTTACTCISTYCQQTSAGVCQCSYYGIALDIPDSPSVSECSASSCAFTSSTEHVCICGSSTYGNGNLVTGSSTSCSPQTQFAGMCGTATQLISCAGLTFKTPSASSSSGGSSGGSNCTQSGGTCYGAYDCCSGGCSGVTSTSPGSCD